MATLAPARTIASPAIRALMARRLAELGGVLLGLAGVALLVALACYNPLDPSFDTATAASATNIAGPAGAVAADLLLQGFGAAAVLPALAALAWSWRIASHRGLGRLSARIASTVAAVPVWAALGAALPGQIQWPSSAGPGGAVGTILAQTAGFYADAAFGPFGSAVALLIGVSLGLLLGWLSLGLSAGEWRAAGRVAGRSLSESHRTGQSLGRRCITLLRHWTASGRRADDRPTEDEPLPDMTPARLQPRGVPREATRQPLAEAPRQAPEPPGPTPARPPLLPAAIKARISLPARKPVPPRQESLPLSEEGTWLTPPALAA